MHYSSPRHPLIDAFLLQREEFRDNRQIIVETREGGEKLSKMLEALQKVQNTEYKIQSGGIARKYRLITTPVDLLEWEYDTEIIGIFPIETLDWKVDQKDIEKYCLFLDKNMQYTEEKLITWLTDHGYIARKSDEVGTYLRLGDTITISTKHGTVRVSFFGTKVEEIYLGDIPQEELKIFTMH